MNIPQNAHLHNLSFYTKPFKACPFSSHPLRFLHTPPLTFISTSQVSLKKQPSLLLFLLCTFLPFTYTTSSPPPVSFAFFLSLSEVRTVLTEKLNPVACDAGSDTAQSISPTHNHSTMLSFQHTYLNTEIYCPFQL